MKMITAVTPMIRQMVLITATVFVFPFSQSLAEPDTGIVWPKSQTTETTQNAVSTESSAEALDITGNLGGESSVISEVADDALIVYPNASASDQEEDDNVSLNPTNTINRSAPTVTLSAKDPNAVRLATIGVETNAIGVLGRTMWQDSSVEDVMTIMTYLPERTASVTLDHLLHHIITSRAMPPQGGTQQANAYLAMRMDWLGARGKSDVMASFVRQLPQDQMWIEQGRFLIDHDLITRNDEDACRRAEEYRAIDEDAVRAEYWSKIQVFCALRSGEDSLAGFQLDLLQDRGVDDAMFYSLIRARLNGSTPQTPGDARPTGLNIALMDLENILITPDLHRQMPISLGQSLSSIGFVDPDTAYLQYGMSFHHRHQTLTDQMLAWPFIPEANIPVALAITQFSDEGFGARNPISDASQRIMLWQSLLKLNNAEEKLNITLIALQHDLDRISGEALAVWSPHLSASLGDMAPPSAELAPEYDRAALLLAIAGVKMPDGYIASQRQIAWQELETAVMAGSVSQEMLRNMDAQDAALLLARVGVSVSPLAEIDTFARRPQLAGTGSRLDYPDMVMLAQHPVSNKPAETVMMIAAILGDMPLHQLDRDDAAILAGALYDAGLITESRQFAIEIMRSWGGYRAARMIEEKDATAS